jgi:hypothetical protein
VCYTVDYQGRVIPEKLYPGVGNKRLLPTLYFALDFWLITFKGAGLDLICYSGFC